jgi:enoyl-CoA hydratase/carnithine racemase
MTSGIEVRDDGLVRWIRFDRPSKKNALTIAMYRAASRALAEAANDPTRAVVFAGHPGAFTAGNDLSDFLSRRDELGAVLAFLDAIADFPKPLLAAVDGVAIGVGTTLLLHCDAAWCTERSLFKTPFVELGLVPEAGSSVLLGRLVGERVATEMLLAGRALGGAEAAAVGLVNGIEAADALEAAVGARAAALAARAPAAVRASKALIRRAHRAAVSAAMGAEAAVFAERLAAPEFAEAATAFLEKRPPDFSRFD